MSADNNQLLSRIQAWLDGDCKDIATGLLREALAALAQRQGEPVRPDVLEKLSYHQLERDDMTLAEVLYYLSSGWEKVHGRSERQLVLQLCALLAGTAPATAEQPAEPDVVSLLMGVATNACAAANEGNAKAEAASLRELKERLTRHLAATAPAPVAPGGWKMIAVNDGFDKLMFILGRAYRKGLMPNSMVEEYEAFEWQSAATAPAPVAPPDALNEMRITLVTAIDGLCSQIENSLYAFGHDLAARHQAEGAVKHARKVADPYRYNGALRAATAAPVAREPLTDAQMEAGRYSYDWGPIPHPFRTSVAIERGVRFAEKHHGITPKGST